MHIEVPTSPLWYSRASKHKSNATGVYAQWAEELRVSSHLDTKTMISGTWGWGSSNNNVVIDRQAFSDVCNVQNSVSEGLLCRMLGEKFGIIWGIFRALEN